MKLVVDSPQLVTANEELFKALSPSLSQMRLLRDLG